MPRFENLMRVAGGVKGVVKEADQLRAECVMLGKIGQILPDMVNDLEITADTDRSVEAMNWVVWNEPGNNSGLKVALVLYRYAYLSRLKALELENPLLKVDQDLIEEVRQWALEKISRWIVANNSRKSFRRVKEFGNVADCRAKILDTESKILAEIARI